MAVDLNTTNINNTRTELREARAALRQQREVLIDNPLGTPGRLPIVREYNKRLRRVHELQGRLDFLRQWRG